MQCFMILAIIGTEIKKLKYFTRREILTKWLVEFVKDNYYARFMILAIKGTEKDN